MLRLVLVDLPDLAAVHGGFVLELLRDIALIITTTLVAATALSVIDFGSRTLVTLAVLATTATFILSHSIFTKRLY